MYNKAWISKEAGTYLKNYNIWKGEMYFPSMKSSFGEKKSISKACVQCLHTTLLHSVIQADRTYTKKRLFLYIYHNVDFHKSWKKTIMYQILSWLYNCFVYLKEVNKTYLSMYVSCSNNINYPHRNIYDFITWNLLTYWNINPSMMLPDTKNHKNPVGKKMETYSPNHCLHHKPSEFKG